MNVLQIIGGGKSEGENTFSPRCRGESAAPIPIGDSQTGTKLSVIVPCYNVAQYLDGFLRCVEKQWGERDDYEVIFVNDGSTDNTPGLLRDFVARDPRHRVLINQKNAGVSAARNAGIDAARGEWIGFADPDDLIADGGYAHLMNHFLDDDTDVVSFRFEQVVSRREFEKHNTEKWLGSTVLWKGCSYDRANLSFQDVWFNLYRKQTLGRYGVRFSRDLSIGETALFNALLMCRGVTLKLVDSKIYFYVSRKQSLSRTLKGRALRRRVCELFSCMDKMMEIGDGRFDVGGIVRVQAEFMLYRFVVSGDLSIKEARRVVDGLKRRKIYPGTAYGWVGRIILYVCGHLYLLPLAQKATRLLKMVGAR